MSSDEETDLPDGLLRLLTTRWKAPNYAKTDRRCLSNPVDRKKTTHFREKLSVRSRLDRTIDTLEKVNGKRSREAAINISIDAAAFLMETLNRHIEDYNKLVDDYNKVAVDGADKYNKLYERTKEISRQVLFTVKWFSRDKNLFNEYLSCIHEYYENYQPIVIRPEGVSINFDSGNHLCTLTNQ